MINPHDLAMYPCKELRDTSLVDILDEGFVSFSLPTLASWYGLAEKDPLTIWMCLGDGQGSEVIFRTTLRDILDLEYEDFVGGHSTEDPLHLVGESLERFKLLRGALAKELEQLDKWIELGDLYAKPNPKKGENHER
jgi:hypothetical protein